MLANVDHKESSAFEWLDKQQVAAFSLSLFQLLLLLLLLLLHNN